MPLTLLFYSTKEQSWLNAYDVCFPVGAGHGIVNAREDVRLVQTLLNIVYFIYPTGNWAPPGGLRELEPDGCYTNATHLFVADFKQRLRANGMPTPKDGKIDPIAANPNTKTRHGYVRVLSVLNFTAYKRCENAGYPQDYDLHDPARRPGAFAVDPRLVAQLQNRRIEPADAPTPIFSP